MKAYAPEKIYISTNSQDGTYYISNQYKRLIEYIRTDAFIENVCEWLSKHAIKYYLDGSKFLGTDKLVEDFKKAMKI